MRAMSSSSSGRKLNPGPLRAGASSANLFRSGVCSVQVNGHEVAQLKAEQFLQSKGPAPVVRSLIDGCPGW